MTYKNFAYKLDLPPLSTELILAFRHWEKNVILSADNKHWLDNFHDNKYNCAAHWFGLIPELEELIQYQYQKYFDLPICALGGVMQNMSSSATACLPPHIDRKRKLAINWYVDLGGDVDTVFYDKVAQTAEESTNYQYHNVHKIKQYQFLPNGWYAYEVNRCHSVENIQTRRTFLSIAVPESIENFGLNELIEQDNFKLLTV